MTPDHIFLRLMDDGFAHWKPGATGATGLL